MVIAKADRRAAMPSCRQLPEHLTPSGFSDQKINKDFRKNTDTTSIFDSDELRMQRASFNPADYAHTPAKKRPNHRLRVNRTAGSRYAFRDGQRARLCLRHDRHD
jgi:hypothetical protein